MQNPNPEEVQQPSLGASALRIPLAGRRLAAAGEGSPSPETSPPIVAAPSVTEEQRGRLRRAIESYRAAR